MKYAALLRRVALTTVSKTIVAIDFRPSLAMSSVRRRLVPLLALTAVCLLPLRAHAGATYHWVVRSGNWTDAGSWSPARTTPHPDDILIFDDGVVGFGGGAGSDLVWNVPNQTIAQLLVTNCWVQLTAASGGGTLTITGGTGDDFVVAHQMSVMMSGVDALALHLAAGATASIAGALQPTGGAHRLEALSANAIVVPAIGTVQTGTGFTGNFFGTGGDGFSVLNSVRFQSGSFYIHSAGANPFGASAPNSVVTFDHGSRFILRFATPSVSGRTYGDFEYDVAGTQTATGAQPMTVDSLVVDQGTFNLGNTGGSVIKGNIRIMPSATLTLGPSSGTATHTLRGTYGQRVDNFGQLLQTGGCTLAIDNVDGVALRGDLSITGTLNFVHGIFDNILGNLRVNSITQITNPSAATGWPTVIQCAFPVGSPSILFPVGTTTDFAPLTVSLTNLMFAHDGGVAVFRGVRTPCPSCSPTFDGSDYEEAQLDVDHKVDLEWRVFFPHDDFDAMDVTTHFDASEVDPGSDPANFVVRERAFGQPGIWSPWRPTTLVAANNSTTSAHVTPNAFVYDLLVGEPAPVTVSAAGATPAPEGGAAPAYATRVQSGGTLAFHVALSGPSVYPVTVDYQTVDGTATAGGSDYTPGSGTLSFALGETAKDVLVTVNGDGTPERNETVGLSLSNATNATLGVSAATDTILDDDDVTAPVAQVLSPNGGETLVDGSVRALTWQASDDVAVSVVDLLLSRDDGATWESIATGIDNTGSYDWTVTLPATTAARLQVVAHDDPGHLGSDTSDGPFAITGSVSVDDAPVSEFSMSLATATPSRDVADLAYALPTATRVQIEVLDVTGRVVERLVSGVQSAGRHQARWAAGRNAPGVYLARMQAPGFTVTRRIILIR